MTLQQLNPNANMAIESKARYLMLNRTQQIKKRQQVMFNRSATEIGLTEQSFWTPIQGQIQPTFRLNYDRHFGHSS